jgi:hypothetical protein
MSQSNVKILCCLTHSFQLYKYSVGTLIVQVIETIQNAFQYVDNYKKKRRKKNKKNKLSYAIFG